MHEERRVVDQVQDEITPAAVSPVLMERFATANSSFESNLPLARLVRMALIPIMPKAKNAPSPTTTPYLQREDDSLVQAERSDLKRREQKLAHPAPCERGGGTVSLIL